MRRHDRRIQVLERLASTPFADPLEMSALWEIPHRSLYDALSFLHQDALVQSVPHATQLIPPTKRYALTAAGVRRLADETGKEVAELLRSLPLSAQWQRVLLQRLDAVAVIYRLAADIARKLGAVRVRWYRRGPLDAGLLLPDGRPVDVVRQGRTSDRTGFAKRLWRLRDLSLPGTVLVLAQDEVRMRHARRLLTGAPLSAVIGVECDVMLAGHGDRVWRLPSVKSGLDLNHVLSYIEGSGQLPRFPYSSRASLPDDLKLREPMQTAPDHLLPVLLKPAQKRALDFIYDWPWITPDHLSELMGVSRSRLWQVLSPLVEGGLVHRVSVRGRLLVLTDRGLGALARRDRTSVRIARRRWSAELMDPKAPLTWRNVTGRRSRQLLRHLDHTAAVHGFLASMARQARRKGWEVVQMDPPMRAARHFRYGGSLHSIHPDAFGLLRADRRTCAFLLEWERRAVRPSTMAERLAPYLRYYATKQPIDDHGLQPDVLVVLRDGASKGEFLRLAHRTISQLNIVLPLMAADGVALNAGGSMVDVWQTHDSAGDVDSFGISQRS